MVRLELVGTTGDGRRAATFLGVGALFAAIYLVDILCARLSEPGSTALVANIALPLDLMVVAPLAFWLAYARPRGKSPILVLPVIYLGGAASAAMSIDGQFALVPCLLVAAAAVDVAVLCLEVPRIARAVRALSCEARDGHLSPSERFQHCVEGVMGISAPARMLAMELAMWWYLLRSWGKPTHCPEGFAAFSYHRESNAAALAAVLVFLASLEAIVVHVALSRVSAALAIAATLATAYALAWLAANTRAMALVPILVGESRVLLRWGLFPEMDLDRSNVADVVIGDIDAPRGERADLSSLGGSPCWVVLREPVERKSLIGGTRMVRYVKVSPDDAVGFRHALLE